MSTNIDLIKKFLPESLRTVAEKYNIPEKYLQEMSELVVLVLNSKSIDKQEEKQSWFNLMPLMTTEQIAKLNDILTREKQKLEEIENKYEQKKNEIKQKYIQRRENMWYTNAMNTIKEKEITTQEKAEQEADQLISNI